MSLSQSKCWYSKYCLHFFKCAVSLEPIDDNKGKQNKYSEEENG